MAPWTRAQVGVLLVSGFDFLVCSMFLLLGATGTGFLSQDVTHYSFFTSLIDVAAFALARSIVIPVLYIAVKIQTLIPLLIIAVLSTIYMGVKIALLATLGRASSDIILLPVHYILTSFVALIGWISVVVAKVSRDADVAVDSDSEDIPISLPPTSGYGSMYASRGVDTSYRTVDSADASISSSVDAFTRLRRDDDDWGSVSSRGGASEIGTTGAVPTSDGPVFIMPSIPRLAALMLDPKQGIQLKENSRFLKSYPRSFTGKDAIDWLMARMPNSGMDRGQAAAVFDTMNDKGYIVCLSRSRQGFDDGDDIYTLADLRKANLPVAKLEGEIASVESLGTGFISSGSNSPQAPYLSAKELPREIISLVADFRDPATGLSIRDRRLTNSITKTMTTYPRCFQGVEAIDWLLMRKRLIQIDDTKALMNILIQADIVYDIASENAGTAGLVQRFNEKHYYRFRVDDTEPQASSANNPRIVERALVNQIIGKLKAHGPAASGTGMQSLDEYYKAKASTPKKDKEKDRETHSAEQAVPASLPKPIIRETPSPSAAMSSSSKLSDSVGKSPSLRNFLEGMKMDGGVPTKQRKVNDRFYVPAFSGVDAVDWVKKEKNLIEREHAQRILQRLLRAGVIRPVKPDSSPTSSGELQFQDKEKVYYYFADDEPPSDGKTPTKVGSVASSAPSTSPWTTPMKTPARPVAPESPSSPSSSVNSTPTRTPSKKGAGALLSNFISEMRDPSIGLLLKDHTVSLGGSEEVTYHDCFIGADAVEWLAKKMNLLERVHAVKILQRLMDQNVILGFQGPTFVDGQHYYRFASEN